MERRGTRGGLAARGNEADDPDRYFSLGLSGLYHAICSGTIGFWPDGGHCCECGDANDVALWREHKCVQHVKDLRGHEAQALPFHHAACIAAYSAHDHALVAAEPRLFHGFLNGVLYDCFSSDPARQAAAVIAKAHLDKFIACLRGAVDSIASADANLPELVTVYRGVEPSMQRWLATLQPGDHRVFPGFLSTSTNDSSAVKFATLRGMVLRFSVPRKMAARIMRWSMFPKEREVLIACGAIAKVTGYTDPDADALLPLVVHLDVVGYVDDDGTPTFLAGSGAQGSGQDASDRCQGRFDGHHGNSAGGGGGLTESSSSSAPPSTSVAATAGEHDSLQTFESFAQHWRAPCPLAVENPVGLPLSAVVNDWPRPAPLSAVLLGDEPVS